MAAKPGFPLIGFVVRNQGMLALLAAFAVLALFVAGAVASHTPLMGVLGVILAGATWFLVKLLGEVVQVIADTLLPR